MVAFTIPLPEEDLAFLLAYSASQGITAEALLARQARGLREHLQRPVHPAVAAASGVIASEIGDDAEDAYRARLEKKHW